ncbi:MAG: AAA family ATPase [Akkermansiaceae bacterium]
MIDKIYLTNFSTFRDLDVDFSSQINVIIGENGCGKTQLLKSIYAANQAAVVLNQKPKDIRRVLLSIFLNIFNPSEEKISFLRNRETTDESYMKVALSDGAKFEINFNYKNEFPHVTLEHSINNTDAGVFIPTKEVLSFINAYLFDEDIQKKIHQFFDATYLDLIKKIAQPENEEVEERVQWMISNLTNKVGGLFKVEDNEITFRKGIFEEYKKTKERQSYHEYFKPIAEDNYSMQFTAEGFKKLGVLQMLLGANHLGTGTNGTLVWDEPESNLNPQLMECLVQALLDLAATGQQIILATHDYVLLKWFDLLADSKKDQHIRYHVLHRDEETNQIGIKSSDNYLNLEPNSISKTFNEITMAQLEKSMGGSE